MKTKSTLRIHLKFLSILKLESFVCESSAKAKFCGDF